MLIKLSCFLIVSDPDAPYHAQHELLVQWTRFTHFNINDCSLKVDTEPSLVKVAPMVKLAFIDSLHEIANDTLLFVHKSVGSVLLKALYFDGSWFGTGSVLGGVALA